MTGWALPVTRWEFSVTGGAFPVTRWEFSVTGWAFPVTRWGFSVSGWALPRASRCPHPGGSALDAFRHPAFAG